MTTLLQRFYRKTVMVGNTGCLLFKGAPNNSGYASFSMGSRESLMTAHRAAWVLEGREIPVDHDLDHLCHNRWCVNVDHLEPVTRQENLRRGKGHESSRADRSKCRNGWHDWTDDNIFIDSHGKNRCLQCHKDRQAEYRERRKA